MKEISGMATATSMTLLETLYREHGPALLAFLRRRFNRGGAEDLLQETFVQAARSVSRVADAASPRAWLFAIARHVGLAAARRRREEAALPDQIAAPEGPKPDPRLDEMRAAIAELPEAMREALELRLREELSYEEIADVLQVPVGTVRSRLHHAVRQLQQRLAAKSEAVR